MGWVTHKIADDNCDIEYEVYWNCPFCGNILNKKNPQCTCTKYGGNYVAFDMENNQFIFIGE